MHHLDQCAMSTRFYFSYMGNKRAEIKYIDALKLNPADYDVIVEPFAGSCALSLELAARDEWKDKKYVICDNDSELVALWRFVRENGADQLYAHCKDKLNDEYWLATRAKDKAGEFLGPLDYFYLRKSGGYRGGMIMKPQRWAKLEKGPHHDTTTAFFQSPNVEFMHADWNECMARYIDNRRALIFLDPPYFNAWNHSYQSMKDRSNTDDLGFATDATVIYVDMREYMDDARAHIISITNGCEIMKFVFAPYIRLQYCKQYSQNTCKDSEGNPIQRRAPHILMDSRHRAR